MPRHPADIILKKLRVKIWMNRILDYMIMGLVVSAIVSLLFMMFVHFYPLVYVARRVFYLNLIISTIFVLVGIFKKPKIQDAAAIGDGLGLEDRLITYIEYKEDDSAIVEAFKEDLEYMIMDNPILSRYKFKINFKNLISAILIVLLSGASYFLPSGARELAEERQDINIALRQESENIKRLRESEEASVLDDEIQRELTDTLKELERKLEKTYSFSEAAADISEGQREISELVDRNRSDLVEALSGVFEGSSVNQVEVQPNFRNGNRDNILELNANKGFSKNEQQKILDSLKREMDKPHTLNTKKALEKIRSKLEKGSLSGEELKKVLKSRDGQADIENIKENTLIKLQEAKERLISQGDKGMNNQGGQQRLSTFAEGENIDYRQGESSNDSRSKLLSGGMGNKPVKSTDGIGGGGQRASGEGDKQGLFGEVAKNIESTRIGEEEGEISQIYGEASESGVLIHSESYSALAIEGEIKALKSSLIEFKKEGINYVLKYDIPLHRKELIMEYFKQLNGGKTDGDGGY